MRDEKLKMKDERLRLENESMNENMIYRETPLKVYKASAGSGKTFTLALEYIKLLITNPFAYRNILAVTFTNKAT